ncbi:unnamed protein product, partial [Didymodactylos carnosus]
MSRSWSWIRGYDNPIEYKSMPMTTIAGDTEELERNAHSLSLK